MGWPLGVAGGCQVTRREVEFRVDTVTFNGTDGTMCVCQRESYLLHTLMCHRILIYIMIFCLGPT